MCAKPLTISLVAVASVCGAYIPVSTSLLWSVPPTSTSTSPKRSWASFQSVGRLSYDCFCSRRRCIRHARALHHEAVCSLAESLKICTEERSFTVDFRMEPCSSSIMPLFHDSL